MGPKTDRSERELEGKLSPFSFGFVATKKVTTVVVITFFFLVLLQQTRQQQ